MLPQRTATNFQNDDLLIRVGGTTSEGKSSQSSDQETHLAGRAASISGFWPSAGLLLGYILARNSNQGLRIISVISYVLFIGARISNPPTPS